jgi:hypothetical protein
MISLPISRNVVSRERSQCCPYSPSPRQRPFFLRPEGISPFRSVFAGLSAATAALLRLAKNYGVRSEAAQDDTCHLVLDLGAYL